MEKKKLILSLINNKRYEKYHKYLKYLAGDTSYVSSKLETPEVIKKEINSFIDKQTGKRKQDKKIKISRNIKELLIKDLSELTDKSEKEVKELLTDKSEIKERSEYTISELHERLKSTFDVLLTKEDLIKIIEEA